MLQKLSRPSSLCLSPFLPTMENHYTEPLLSNSGDGQIVHHEEKNSIIIPENEPHSMPSISYGDEPIYISSVSDFLKEFYVELKKLWNLAFPSILSSISQYGIGAFTQIYAGQLGTIQLAAFSVENSVIGDFGYSILAGMGSALETLCGQAYGAKQYSMLGIYMQKSWLLLNSSVLPIILLFIFATPVLKLLGQTDTIAKQAGSFALMMIPQQFAYAILIPLSKFLQAQSKVMEMAVIAAVALCVHSILGWYVILKLGWGLPAAAVMLNGSWWFIAMAQFLYVVLGCSGQAWTGFSSKALTNLPAFFKLSVSSALMGCLVMWYTMGVILLAGFLKNAEVSVAALSVCLNILGWASMVGNGFNAAISVRVSNELGSGRSRAAKFSVLVVGVTSTLFGVLFALVLMLQRKQYPALFSNDDQVKTLVDELTPMLAVSIVFGCIPLNGVAVGAGWQNFVAYMVVGSYFLFGAPLGILMCYKFDMGLKGLWCGMILGGCLQTVGIFLLICLTNWHKEAHTARKRLKQMEGATLAICDEEK